MRWVMTALSAATLAACGGSGPSNELPKGIKEISATAYPATTVGKGDTAATQDLLTGGMGRTGLGAAATPAYADPANPTAAELRRNALYSNYRGILDPSAGGGYGLLYGPNVTADGQVTSNEGLIPGREYVAVLDDGTGRKQTVIAVQVPDSFSASNPCIVLGASSGSRAAEEAAHSRFRDAGQSCNAAKRMVLAPEIAEDFLQAFLDVARRLQSGDPRDPATTLAPLARADLRDALHQQVIDARAHGARCLLGGELPDGPGFFYPATVLDQISPACRVWREETFGPVASVLRAHSDLDAIRLANDTPFGLGASIYSADVERAQALAAELEVGSVFINRHTSSDLRLPFGGVKASGYGRELSEFGLYEFVNVKTYWQR